MSIHPLFVASVHTGDSIKISTESGVIYDSSDVNVGYVQGQDKQIPAIVCDGYLPHEKWRVLNIVNGAGVLLDNIAVLGAVSDDQVVRLTQKYLNVDLEKNKILSHADANDQALKYFLDGANLPTRTQYFLQKDADILANLPTKNEVKWNDETGALISHNGNLGQVMYDMAVSDIYDELTTKVTPKEIISMLVDDQCEMQMYDAMVMKYRNLTNAMNKIAEAMKGLTDDEFHVVSVTPIEPFKRQGVVNVGAIFEMSDTQQVTILFNNPDATPSKLTDSDVITSWKWMLNKRDVTAALQPRAVESRKYPMIANRLMKLLVKNHSRFVRAQSRKLKEEADLREVTEQLEASLLEIQNAQQNLNELQNQIDAETAKKQQETSVISSDADELKDNDVLGEHNSVKKANALFDLLIGEYGFKKIEHDDFSYPVDGTYYNALDSVVESPEGIKVGIHANYAIEGAKSLVPLFIDLSAIGQHGNLDTSKNVKSLAQKIIELLAAAKDHNEVDVITKPMDLPEGYKLNQIAIGEWKLSHVDLVGSVVDIYLNERDGTYVAAFENRASSTTSATQQDINEALIWGIGAIRQAIDAQGEETVYLIKSENPRARKPVGKIKIKPIQGGYDLNFSKDGMSGGFGTQSIQGAKAWIQHRMSKFGSGDPSWTEIAKLLTLESGIDVLGIEPSVDLKEMPVDLPDGFTLNKTDKIRWSLKHADVEEAVVIVFDDVNYQAIFGSATSTYIDDFETAVNWGVNVINERLGVKDYSTQGQTEKELVKKTKEIVNALIKDYDFSYVENHKGGDYTHYLQSPSGNELDITVDHNEYTNEWTIEFESAPLIVDEIDFNDSVNAIVKEIALRDFERSFDGFDNEFGNIINDENSPFHDKNIEYAFSVQNLDDAVKSLGLSIAYGDFNATTAQAGLFDALDPKANLREGVMAQIGSKDGEIVARAEMSGDGDLKLLKGGLGAEIFIRLNYDDVIKVNIVKALKDLIKRKETKAAQKGQKSVFKKEAEAVMGKLDHLNLSYQANTDDEFKRANVLQSYQVPLSEAKALLERKFRDQSQRQQLEQSIAQAEKTIDRWELERKIPDEPFMHNGREISPIEVNGKMQWVIQSTENRERKANGQVAIGGDRIEPTKQQAIDAAKQLDAEDEKNEALKLKNAENAAKYEAEVQAEQLRKHAAREIAEVQDYIKDLKQLQKDRVTSHLSKKINFGRVGSALTYAEAIVKAIKEFGATIQIDGTGTEALVLPQVDKYVESLDKSNIGAMGMKFAHFVANKYKTSVAIESANEDQLFLESIISGEADLSAVGDRLMTMGENLDPALSDVFEQAAEKYAEYAIANAASV